MKALASVLFVLTLGIEIAVANCTAQDRALLEQQVQNAYSGCTSNYVCDSPPGYSDYSGAPRTIRNGNQIIIVCDLTWCHDGSSNGSLHMGTYSNACYPIIDPDLPPDPPCATSISGSIILPDSMVLGEQIPIVGTNFKLNYFTSRVKGRKQEYTYNMRLKSEHITTGTVVSIHMYDGNNNYISTHQYTAPNVPTSHSFFHSSPSGSASNSFRFRYTEYYPNQAGSFSE